MPVRTCDDGLLLPSRARRGNATPWLIGVLLLVLIGGAIYYFVFLADSGRVSPELALVPGDAVGFASVRVADVVNSEVGKEALAALPADAREQLKEAEAKVGLTLADVERVTAVLTSVPDLSRMREGPPAPPEWYAFLVLSKPLDQKKVLAEFFKDGKEVEHGGKKFQAAGDDRAIYFHDDKTVIVGSPAGVKKAIDQASKPKADGSLVAALTGVDRQHLAFGFAPTAEMLNAAKQQGASPAGDLADLKAVSATGTLQGKSLGLDVAVTLGSTAKATDLKKTIDDAKPSLKGLSAMVLGKAPPEAEKALHQLIDNLKTSQSGSKVTVSSKMDVPVEQLKTALASAGGLFGKLDQAKTDLARVQIKTLEQAIQMYQITHDAVPATLDVLLQPDPKQDNKPYLKDREALLDPWGKPYKYEPKPDGPVLSTTTPDGKVIGNKP